MGVDVISPVLGTTKAEAISLADFPQNDKGAIAACPQGHAPVKRKQGKKGVLSVAFASVHCAECPVQGKCPAKKGKKHHYLHFTPKALRLAARRAYGGTPEFKDKYRWRAGIEATFSEMDRKTGIKKLRVRGMLAVGFCANLKAVGVNIFRAARVKRVGESLQPGFGGVLSGVELLIYAVKEQIWGWWRRLGDIMVAAVVAAETMPSLPCHIKNTT